MRRTRALFAKALPMVILTSLLVLVGGSPTQATTQPWSGPVSLSDMTGAQNLTPLPNGNVIVSCSYYTSSVAVRTVTASGGSQGDVSWSSNPAPDACDGVTAVASDGTVYTQAASTTTNARYIVAYGAHQWSTALTTSCSNVWNYPISVVLGYDGNVYAFVGSQGQCSASGSRLMGFNPTTGAIVLNISLGNTQSGGYNGLQVYDTGLIVWWGNQLRYFDYSGNEQSTAVDFNLGSGEMVAALRGGTGGKVLTLVVKNQSTTPTCPYGQVVSRVAAFDSSGLAWSYAVGGCQQFQGWFSSTPSNGAVFVANDWVGNDHVTAVNGSGTPAWSQPYDLDTGNDGVHVFGYYIHAGMKADNNGNVAVWQYYHSQDNQRLGIQVNILDGSTGVRRSAIYTDDLLTNKSFNGAFVGLGTDRLYLMATVCNSGTCGGAPSLFAVNVPGLGLDFPRAAALGVTPQQPVVELKLVALGDSYASGEGVPPFEGASLNGCHRSTRAYARQLDVDPDRSLALQGFVACSGATTADVRNGKFGEEPQLSSLRIDTDIVTIGIGGDDAGFKDLAEACVLSSCSGSIYTSTIGKIHNDLPSALDELFTGIDSIQSKIGQNTRVLVIGYPRVVPDVGAIIDWPNCAYLQDGDDLASARNIVVTLNQELSAAASRAGSQFEYVDPTGPSSPFNGHELCTNSSYFNGLNGGADYALHPNLMGQSAYEYVISHFLANA